MDGSAKIGLIKGKSAIIRGVKRRRLPSPLVVRDPVYEFLQTRGASLGALSGKKTGH